MNSRLRPLCVAATLALATLCTARGTFAQARGGTQTRRAQPAQPTRPTKPAQPTEGVKPPAGWTQKTPDGQSDLQGYWSAVVPMITSPEGGIPPLSAEGEKRQADLAARQSVRGHDFDSRCILWNSEEPLTLSPSYNSNLQIVQGQGYVMILQELMHDVRLIPIDNLPHLDSNITQRFGDSRGYWDGETLIVETANYSGHNPFQPMSSEKLKLTERFRRIDDNTLQYEFTIDDPVWMQPWSAAARWVRTEGPLPEYACHEETAEANEKRI